MVFPADLETLDTDIGAGQSTSSRTHSEQHNDENRILMALMQKVGIDNSVDPNSLDYLIRHMGGVGVTLVQAFFDDVLNSLPLDTSIQIDGYTIQDGDKIYVVNSATAGEIDSIYTAAVSGTTIVWTLDHVRAANEIVYAEHGTVYGNTFFFGGSVFVQNTLTALTAFFTNLNATNATINNLSVTNITVGGGGSVQVVGSWEEQTFDNTIPGGDTCQLTSVPIDAKAIFVFKKDSGLVRFQTTDYTYDPITHIVTLTTPLTVGEEVQCKYMIGNSIVLTGVKPSDLEATNAPVDSYTIIKTPGQDKFTFVPLTGGTGTIPGFNEPYHDNTYKAVETIAIGEHCCKQTYSGIHLLDHADYLFSQANPIIAKKFGQCVYVPVSGYLVTIAPWITFFDGYQSFAYTCDAAIYAITGTYGVDATPTGPALYTAPQQGGSTGGSGATSNWSPAFVFNTNLPAGYYCVEFTLNFGGGGGLGPWTQIYGDNTSPAYFGNAVEDSITPHVGMNMYLNLIMTPQTVAALANANNVATADWIGVATENKNADEDIIIQDRGEITHSGAFNDDAIWYLRDVAGQISLVPGTNVRIIGQGSGTNKIWMGRTQTMTEINITQDLVYYTNTELVAEGSFHVAYGGIQMGGYVNIQISDDNSTRYTLNKSGNINGSGGDNDPGCQAIIPIGKFFKIGFDVAGGATITPRRCRIRPIK